MSDEPGYTTDLESLYGDHGPFARYDLAPVQETMRGGRQFSSAPSTDQKKVRRRLIHRSGAHAFEEPDWEELHPTLKDWADNGELHRGIGVNLPDDLHRYIHDDSQPSGERAHALLRHIQGEREGRDHRTGLGMHWSLENGIAENSAEIFAKHHADTNAGKQDQHDFSWGSTPGEEPDYTGLQNHLADHHGFHHDEQPGNEGLEALHTHLHRGAPAMPGQQALFPQPPHDPKRLEHAQMGPAVDPGVAHGKPATEVILHTPIPPIEDIETHIHGNPNSGGDVYHPFGHSEREVPIRSGASIPITGISWKPHYEWSQEPDDAPDYTHHRFDEHAPHHEAKKIASWGGQWGDDYSPSDWDSDYPHKDDDPRHASGVHRTLKINMDKDLWRHMNGQSGASDEEVAHHVLNAATKHPNLGLHWTDDLDHAYRVAKASNWGMGQSWYRDHNPGHDHDSFPGTVIVHAKWPKREHIETDPDTLRRYNVGGYGQELGPSEEYEVPIKTGAPVHITGVSWSSYDTPHKSDFKRHDFTEPKQHTAKIATVLNTQIERLNQGDQIRTPTGQTSEVKGLRPHETDSTLMYLDTDQGTSTVKRGTNFQVVPKNSQQQELPDIGNPMGGNSAQLPGGGHGPGGPGTPGGQPNVQASTCPNCGNSGTLHLQGSNYVCSVCGFTIAAGGSPGGLLFTNQPSGVMPNRRKPGEVPKAHVWAAKYKTSNETEGQIARRARQALGGQQ